MVYGGMGVYRVEGERYGVLEGYEGWGWKAGEWSVAESLLLLEG